jgi:hypothetical protein
MIAAAGPGSRRCVTVPGMGGTGRRMASALAGVLSGLFVGLAVLVVAWSFVLLLAMVPGLGYYNLSQDRQLQAEGRHGTLTVQSCERRDGPRGRWTCTGRFESDDTELTVDNVVVTVDDRPEIVTGWVSGPDADRLHQELTLAPGWIIAGLAVVAIVVAVIGGLLGLIKAIGSGVAAGGFVHDHLS